MTNPRPKTPGRKRRVAGWTVLAFAILATSAWLISGWWAFSYQGRKVLVGCSWGTFFLTYQPARFAGIPAGALGWQGGPVRPPGIQFWRLEYISNPTGDFALHLPPWPVPLLLTAAAIPLLRSAGLVRRRAALNLCPRCGYDTRGLAPNALCPECGRAA
jgi:hypothetical protein